MDEPNLVLAWIAASVLVLLGIAGTVVPALPSAPLVFLGMLVAAWADRFRHVGWVTLTLLGLLTLASFVADLWATHRVGKRFGSSPLAMAGAMLGTLAGLFFSLPGLLLGPFLGAFAGELLARRSLRQAGRAGLGAWLATVLGSAARLAIIAAMLGLFVTAWWL